MTTSDVFGYSLQDSWDYENGFHLVSDPTRLAKIVAHYELYKLIVDLPGHVIECGVFKGASFIRFATFRSILESQHSRRLIGFDAFGAFPQPEDVRDKAFVDEFESNAGQGIPREDLERALLQKGFTNFDLVAGDINTTLADYCDGHPELRISALHIDVDVYEPTLTALRLLYPRVVPGGLLILDDYGTVAGETRAFEDYFSDQSPRLRKLPISHIPAYVVKE